jgi:hypothetical protein
MNVSFVLNGNFPVMVREECVLKWSDTFFKAELIDKLNQTLKMYSRSV